LNSRHTFRLTLAALAMASMPAFAVDYNTTADYVSIGFEAEEFITKDERWVMTNAGTQQGLHGADPDPNHSGSASGGVYFEVLPDVRVTHADPMGPPAAYWGQPGQGPEMSWQVNIPEPGRYYVHGRAYSTGTEDNGIHFGINGTWPQSARMMQFCTAGARDWRWSSAQRDAGGVGSCGIQKSLYLDIENAGMHIINASAREDGFELDRIVLIKDLSGNTKTCSPSGATGISCKNGGIEMADEQTDVAVTLVTDPETIGDGTDEVSDGNSFTVTAVVENHDKFDDALDIVLTTEFAAGLMVTGVPADCSLSGQTVTCNLAMLEPTSPTENHSYAMDVTVLEADSASRAIDATVENSVFDGNVANNTASVDVAVSVIDLSTDVAVELGLVRDTGADDLLWSVGELGKVNLMVTNDSANEATNVSVAVQIGAGMKVDLLPSDCVGSSTVTCSISSLAAGESKTFSIDVSATSAGAQVVNAEASLANDGNASNNRDSIIAIFEAASEVTGPTVPVGGPAGDSDVAVGGGSMDWPSFLLMLFGLACVYGWHQRQPIPVRQKARTDVRSSHHRIVKHDQ